MGINVTKRAADIMCFLSLTGKLAVNFRKFVYFQKVFLKSLLAKFYSLKNVFCPGFHDKQQNSLPVHCNAAISISSQIASPLGVSVKLFIGFPCRLMWPRFYRERKAPLRLCFFLFGVFSALFEVSAGGEVSQGILFE